MEEDTDEDPDAKLVDEELQRRAESNEKAFRAKKDSTHTTADQRRKSERRSEWDKRYDAEIRSEAEFNNGFRRYRTIPVGGLVRGWQAESPNPVGE